MAERAQYAEVRVQNWVVRDLHTLGVQGFKRAHPGYVDDLLEQVISKTAPPLEPGLLLRHTRRGPKRYVYEVGAIGTDGKVMLWRRQGPWTDPSKPIGSFKIVDAATLWAELKDGVYVPA